MKSSIKKWLYRIVVLVILLSSVASCFNSFNNSLDSDTLEKVDEIQQEVDYLTRQLDSIEMMLQEGSDIDFVG